MSLFLRVRKYSAGSWNRGYAAPSEYGDMTNSAPLCGSQKIFLFVAGALMGAFSFPLAMGFRAGDLILGVMGIALLVLRGRPVAFPPWYSIYIPVVLLLCAWLVFSTLVSSQAFEGLYQPIRYLLVLLVPLIIFFNCSQECLLVLVKGFVFGAVLLFGLGSILYFLRFEWLVMLDWVSASRLSFWFNPNTVGTISVFAFLFSIFLFLIGENRSRWLWLLVVIIIPVPLLFSMSFGSIMLAAVGVFIFILGMVIAREGRSLLKLGTVAMIALPAVFFGVMQLDGVGLPDRFPDRILSKLNSDIQGEEGVGSASVRLEYNRLAFQSIDERPFLGFGANSREDLGFYPHSTPVLMLLEGGVVALGLWVLIAVILLSVIIHGLRSKRPVAIKIIASVMFFSWLVLNIRVPHMYESYFYVPMFLTIALLVSRRAQMPR